MNKIITTIAWAALTFSFASCLNSAQQPNESHPPEEMEDQQDGHEKQTEGKVVHLSEAAFKRLDMRVDTLPVRMLSGIIEANGQLEVPPQYEATVTAIVGANVTSIQVVEGDKVVKGKVIAYLAHPDLIQLQTDYLKAFNKLQFLQQHMQRQNRLYNAEVSSGRAYQKAKSDYLIQKASVAGWEAQLAQLHLYVDTIREGKLYRQVPVVAPITGYIADVEVGLGEYVPPEKPMFTIINSEEVHADLLAFEKDVHQIEKGQTVLLTTESIPGRVLKAKIFAIGKKFEQDPRAVHIHAEIEGKHKYRLIPSMYVQGKIQTHAEKVKALPDDAIITEKGRSYIFTARLQEENGEKKWAFTQVEVRTGMTVEGWTAIKLLRPLAEGTPVAWNNAYYLIAEMNKSEAEHHH